MSEANRTPPRRVDSTAVEAVEWVRSRLSLYYGEGEAAYGVKSAHKQGFFGFRLHLLTNPQGVPLVFALCPANYADITILPQLVEGKERRRAFGGWRQRIESVIKMLKDPRNLEDILARSTEGFQLRVHRKVTALTLAMLVNLILGRELLHVKELLA